MIKKEHLRKLKELFGDKFTDRGYELLRRIENLPLESHWRIEDDKEYQAKEKLSFIKRLIEERGEVTCPRGYLLQLSDDFKRFRKLEWNDRRTERKADHGK